MSIMPGKGKAVGQKTEMASQPHAQGAKGKQKWVKAINAQSLFPVIDFLQPACPSCNLPRQHQQLGPTVQTREPIRDISHANHHKGL